jgi:hypothetical protein
MEQWYLKIGKTMEMRTQYTSDTDNLSYIGDSGTSLGLLKNQTTETDEWPNNDNCVNF